MARTLAEGDWLAGGERAGEVGEVRPEGADVVERHRVPGEAAARRATRPMPEHREGGRAGWVRGRAPC